MEPEQQYSQQAEPLAAPAAEAPPAAPAPARRGAAWVFFGPNGLRAGWSVLMFVVLLVFFGLLVGFVFVKFHLFNPKSTDFTAGQTFFTELLQLLPIIGAAAVVGLVEHRRILDYNLRGPRPAKRFVSGLVAGFIALSVLIAALAVGGFLHFGPIALSGAAIFRSGALWGCVFLLVGCTEEGLFRCYLLFTLSRGINFWWALGVVAAVCLDLAMRAKGQGPWGVYAVALLGVVPCFVLYRKAVPGNGFWQAAWASSAVFGFLHTGNNGENWIGVLAAAGIGFVFCVSVRLTGSAWWAIGFHAAWDWGESYFYGTADSGLVAQGHLLTTSPAGRAFWSGGTDGPEGSFLALGVILLVALFLVVVYGRGNAQTYGSVASPAQPLAG